MTQEAKMPNEMKQHPHLWQQSGDGPCYRFSRVNPYRIGLLFS